MHLPSFAAPTYKMEVSVKGIFTVGLLFLAVYGMASFDLAHGAGECGPNTTPDNQAPKMFPCLNAAKDGNANVSPNCCSAVRELGRNAACLCAVMLSNTARNAGVVPRIAVTIPQRCNIAERPKGYRCGGYTLP